MNISTENYYSNKANTEYMSVSQYKAFLECEACAYAQYVTGEYVPPEKECYLAGNYVGTQFESQEAHKRFLEQNSDHLYKKGGKELLKKFSELDVLYNRASKDENFMKYMTGEHEQIFTAELFGVPWKIRIDCINHDLKAIVDLKTCKDFKDVWHEEYHCKVPFYEAYNYYLQLAVYKSVYYKCTGKWYNCYITAITKETAPDLDVIEFNNDGALQRMQQELDSVKQYLPEIMAIKAGQQEPARCGKCEYCKKTKKITTLSCADGGLYYN